MPSLLWALVNAVLFLLPAYALTLLPSCVIKQALLILFAYTAIKAREAYRNVLQKSAEDVM